MPRILSAAAAALALLACSTVPAPVYPPFHEYQVRAEYRFDPVTGNRVAIPRSDGDLTVLELRAEPAALAEVFADGQRWLVLPDGCASLTVHCRYRDYARDGDGHPRPPLALFPGAASLRIAP